MLGGNNHSTPSVRLVICGRIVTFSGVIRIGIWWAQRATTTEFIAALTPTFHSIHVDASDAEGTEESVSHAPGSMLSVSYSLKLLPTGADIIPAEAPDEDHVAMAADGVPMLTLLEERVEDKVLLGGGVLTPVIEDVVAGMDVGASRRLLIRAILLGHPVSCQLHITLHTVETPDEEKMPPHAPKMPAKQPKDAPPRATSDDKTPQEASKSRAVPSRIPFSRILATILFHSIDSLMILEGSEDDVPQRCWTIFSELLTPF